MRYLFFIALIFAFACSSKEKEEDDVEWAEMEAFHTEIADVYHPLKDSNDLEPIKKGAARLSAAATKWKESELPSKVDNEEIKDMLFQLDTEAGLLNAEIISGAGDEQIAKDLTKLHDTFHSIMEKWYQAGKEEGAEEHHDH